MSETRNGQSAHYTELRTIHREASTLGSVAALTSWDQETYMPPGAAAHRAEQEALLAGLIHERLTSPRIGELLRACEEDGSLTGDPSSADAANIREMRRDYDMRTRLPRELVSEIARTGSRTQQVWKKAREASDFQMFAPWLDKMMNLARRKADCYGIPEDERGRGERYDALLNEFEPSARAAEIEAVFTPLRERLSAFVQRIASRGTAPDDAPILVRVAEDRQHRFGLRVLQAIGFDLERGRLDVTTHPFCSGMAPGDTRLTTRYRDEKFTDALYGTMHEGGHGLYEQGLPKDEHFGEPLGGSISLGIHESQSRMWENMVGRGRPFWEWAMPIARDMFAGALDPYSVDDLYRACNIVRPTYIRVEADEATYNLHVMLRFEVERALLRGDLEAADVPGVWNETFERLLGIPVPDDRRGCLQDVHWSFGLIGYFPTYALGNLYAAQLWEKILADIPGLEDGFRRGEFGPLLDWLREHVHRHGRRYGAAELCERVTGKPLSAEPLMRHLESRVGPAYGM